ncbi:MAG: hypothetical protein JWN23_1832 [Rhodocyclales bacterium]|nr:hypothetical protein [Rhodocyclales bacterium]
MTTSAITEAISVLNDLIETSKDGEKGFLRAADDTSSVDLRVVLLAASQRCAAAARELQNLVTDLGGEPEKGGSIAGAIHRGWLDLKSTVMSRDDLAVLEECERGEDFAKRRYAEALDKDLPDHVRAVVLRQYEGVIINHDRVKSLRDERR